MFQGSKAAKSQALLIGEDQENKTASLTQKLDPGTQGLLAYFRFGMCAPLAFPGLEAAQGLSLKIEMWDETIWTVRMTKPS